LQGQHNLYPSGIALGNGGWVIAEFCTSIYKHNAQLLDLPSASHCGVLQFFYAYTWCVSLWCTPLILCLHCF
jgi:hypothetical protein